MKQILLDNRLRAAIDGAFTSRCTIATPDFTTNAAKQKVPDGNFTTVSGLANLACRISPLIELRPTDTERRGTEVIKLITVRQCKLNGYFPSIVADTHYAQVDGTNFPIIGVEHDGNRFSTRLRLQVVTP